MPAKKTNEQLIKECPNCGAANRISMNLQHKRVRCGECKEELPPLPQPKIKEVDRVAAATKNTKPSAEPTVRKRAKARKVAAKKPLKTPTKPSKAVAPKSQKAGQAPKPITDLNRLDAIGVSSVTMIPESEDLDVITPRQESMLSVSFDEAMRINPLLEQLGKQVQFDLVKHIASHGGDVLASALAGAAIISERGTVVVKFTAEGAKLLKAKELRFMGNVPSLVNKAGRTVENAKLTGPLTTGTRVAANLTMAVVTVAHVISGADLAKKLNKLDSKVGFLVAAHRIDQLARIEGVYRQAKEILHMEQNDHTRWELHRLCRELFEVRSAWRREISFHVGNLKKTTRVRTGF